MYVGLATDGSVFQVNVSINSIIYIYGYEKKNSLSDEEHRVQSVAVGLAPTEILLFRP